MVESVKERFLESIRSESDNSTQKKRSNKNWLKSDKEKHSKKGSKQSKANSIKRVLQEKKEKLDRRYENFLNNSYDDF
jgi:hypothetical protein